MSVGRKKPPGIILAGMILVSLVLLLLVTALLTSGTSSLRTTTLATQTDVAAYAAEAGLVEAAEEYRRSGKLPTKFAGKVDGSKATYLVTRYENVTTLGMQIPGGPTIPPSTLYLLSEGVSPNGTHQKAGALFRTGLGVFQAGVVSDSLMAEKATFDAYDSTLDTDPSRSRQPDRGILASNRADKSQTDPQYSLLDTTVSGGVFVAPGSTPTDHIKKEGATEVSREGTLASPIVIDKVKVPVILKGGTTEGGSTTTKTFDPTAYSPGKIRFNDLKVSYNPGSQSFSMKDDGGLLSSTKVGNLTITQLQNAAQADPPTTIVVANGKRRLTIDIANNEVRYQDPKGKDGSWPLSSTAFAPVVQAPEVDTVNPDTIGPGAFSSITIDDDTPTLLEDGTYVIRETGNHLGGDQGHGSRDPAGWRGRRHSCRDPEREWGAG